MQLTTRDRVIGVLRAVGLNKIAAKAVYGLQGFGTAPALVEAVNKALEYAQANGVAGDYLEFGIWKGASLLNAQKRADELGLGPMRFFGFDSFKGLPDEPDQHKKIFYEGQYSCSERQVRTWLSRYGGDWRRLVLVPGFYEHTLTQQKKQELGVTACAVALIDCDLYSSSKLALTWIDDLLCPGSVVIFDDWDAYGNDEASWEDGQRKAMREHEPRSRWVFNELFHYDEGLRGGLAFVCAGPRQG